MKVLAVVICAFLAGCGLASPDAGHEAVLVMKPLFFGHGGIYPEPIKTGRSLVALTTDVVDVVVVPTQYAVHFEDLMSLDGVPLDFDAVIRLIEAIDNEISQMMEKYIREAGIPVRLVQITVGKANPPDAIKNQRTLQPPNSRGSLQSSKGSWLKTRGSSPRRAEPKQIRPIRPRCRSQPASFSNWSRSRSGGRCALTGTGIAHSWWGWTRFL